MKTRPVLSVETNMSSPDLMVPPVALPQSTAPVVVESFAMKGCCVVLPAAGHVVDPRTMSPSAEPATMGLPSGAIVIDRMAAPALYPKRTAHSASPAGETLTVKPSPYDTALSAVDD